MGGEPAGLLEVNDLNPIKRLFGDTGF